MDLGGRSLKVLATPGHLPDSIAQFDARNGLLFTGDTYYPGPIYVFGPGADPAAYQRSVDRLAALAPQMRHVLGGQNVPLAPLSILPELAREFAEVRSRKLTAAKSDPKVSEYHGDKLVFFVNTSGVRGSRRTESAEMIR
ncbi:MAG: MBL fold metallo-hydrolase [Xanthomonadaceae bacterium]|nr:MBL fold metallo-hydrolase [Xanthomonadaceae bacterium]MDE1965201.1 MBL fold metallo-hydrolase [Xanthomonadaceae bacterium]